MKRTGLLRAAVALAALGGSAASAVDRHVPSGYASIASALAAASFGDRIILAPGIYREYDLVLKSGVMLLGRPQAPGDVVIDAQGQGRVLRAENLASAATVIGVTITGGHADGTNAYEKSGGGVLVSKATVKLEDTVVSGNEAAGNGGGVRVARGELQMFRCVVRDNAAGRGGGGLAVCYGSWTEVAEALLAGNSSAWGGAAAVRAGSTARFVECRFEANQTLAAPGLGGGLACDHGATAVLVRCLVADNSARRGGGIYVATGAGPIIQSVTVDRNESVDAVGGIYTKGCSLELTRCIVSFHAQAAFSCTDGAVPTLVATNIYGNAGGDWTGALASQLGVHHNFSADPLYCAVDDRHLRSESPCLPQNNGVALIGAFGEGCGPVSAPPAAPPAISLSAWPNPFNPATRISFELPSAARVRLSVYDVRGRRLVVLVDELRSEGAHQVLWRATDATGGALASGAYVALLEIEGQRQTVKLLLAR